MVSHLKQFPFGTFEATRLAGSPTSIRNPYKNNQRRIFILKRVITSYLRESRDGGGGRITSDVIYGHTGLGIDAQVVDLWHALECTILRLEVRAGGPVVGEILGVCATRTCR